MTGSTNPLHEPLRFAHLEDVEHVGREVLPLVRELEASELERF